MDNGDIMTALYSISGGLLSIIGLVFFMTIKKLDKSDFVLHCKEQKEDFNKLNGMELRLTNKMNDNHLEILKELEDKK